MAERCELCGARWEVGTFTCRDCGSKRRVTVQPGESSASMPGLEFVREALAHGAVPAASESSSGVAMVRVDASSAPFAVADGSASAIPVVREASPSASSSAAAPIDGVFPSSVSTLPARPVPELRSAPFPSSVGTLPSAITTQPAKALPAPVSPESLRASASGAGVPTVLPAGFSQRLTRPGRGALLVLGAAVSVAVAVGVTMWLTRAPAEPEAKLEPVEVGVAGGGSSCEQLAALAGSWVFTTATTGARRKERLGVRGFYQLQVTVDGCTARATLAKTGRTDRTMFDDDKIPRAEATLAQGEGFEAYGWAGTFVLRNEDGQGIDTRFVLALDGERLVGNWRQLGERWASSGLYGVLEGRRDGDPVAILPERSTQPCTVRCATPEDIAQLDAPSQPAYAACMTACK